MLHKLPKKGPRLTYISKKITQKQAHEKLNWLQAIQIYVNRKSVSTTENIHM